MAGGGGTALHDWTASTLSTTLPKEAAQSGAGVSPTGCVGGDAAYGYEGGSGHQSAQSQRSHHCAAELAGVQSRPLSFHHKPACLSE